MLIVYKLNSKIYSYILYSLKKNQMNFQKQPSTKRKRPLQLKLNSIKNKQSQSNNYSKKVFVQISNRAEKISPNKETGETSPQKTREGCQVYLERQIKYETSVRFDQKYRLLEKLGEGANGVVFRCQKKDGSGQFAVKKTRCQIEQIAQQKKSYNIMKLLNHDGIIKYKSIYICSSQHKAYLVMEFFKFPTLEKAIINSEDQIKNISFKLLDAISYMHQMGLCHRDIKPDNILYDEKTKKIKIIDFGISKQVKIGKNKKLMLTCTGTLHYKAPELFKGGLYDQLIDQWAAGITIYQLISGVTPFQSDSVRTTIENIEQGKLAFKQPIWDKYSPFAKDLIRRLLSPRQSRLTAEEAKNNLWFHGTKDLCQSFRERFQTKKQNTILQSLNSRKNSTYHGKNKRIIYNNLKQLTQSFQNSEIDDSDSQTTNSTKLLKIKSNDI